MSAKGWGQSMIDEAMEKGMEKGIEKGLYEGLEKGKTAGHREGLEKGIVNMKKAVRMLHCGMNIGQIIEETGIEEKQIIELKEIMDSPVMMVAEENHHFSHHD